MSPYIFKDEARKVCVKGQWVPAVLDSDPRPRWDGLLRVCPEERLQVRETARGSPALPSVTEPVSRTPAAMGRVGVVHTSRLSRVSPEHCS